MATSYITRTVYDLVNMVAGDDWYEFIEIVQADNTTAFDFAGWNAVAEVRDPLDDSLIATFDSSASSPTIVFADGGMYLKMAKAATALITPKEYVWSCRFTDDNTREMSHILRSRFQVVDVPTEV